MLTTSKEVIEEIKKNSSEKARKAKAYFGINDSGSYGLTSPQMRTIAKAAGKNHALALELWETGIHEARHIATMIADKDKLTKKMMNDWLKDFNSWDIVDGCCFSLFEKSPHAWEYAIKWTSQKGEFQKRAGFSMMAGLAVHDKKATDKQFEKFFPALLRESHDERNFVKKAINWAIRQIGKRNSYLCDKSIALAEKIQAKGDPASRWIAADALRELRKYKKEGRIKNIGN